MHIAAITALLAAVIVLGGGIASADAQLALSDITAEPVNVYSTLRLEVAAENASGDVRYSINPIEDAFIHPVSGHLYYVPAAGQPGIRNITVTAQDDDETVSTVISVTVNAPVATITNMTRSDMGRYVATFDVGPDFLWYRFQSINNDVSESHSGSNSGPKNVTGQEYTSRTFDDTHPAPNTIYFFVARHELGFPEHDDRIVYAQFVPGRDGFEIIPNPFTRPAHYVPDLNATAKAGRPETVMTELSDNDGNNVTITAVTNGTSGTARTNGTAITYTPYTNATGDDMVTYTVTDNKGTNVTGTVTIAIEQLVAPSFVVLPNTAGADAIHIPESARFAFDINVTNPDSIPYTLNVTLGEPAADGATIEPNGTFHWTPGEEHGGATYPVTIYLVPEETDPVSRQIMLHVNETNQDPVFEEIDTDRTATVRTQFSLDLNATDDDRPPQTVSYQIVSQNPSENPATIDRQTGIISWTPVTAETRTITVRASDDHTPNGTAELTLTVEVGEAPVTAADDEATGSGLASLVIPALQNDMPAAGLVITDVASNLSEEQTGAFGAVTRLNGTHLVYEPGPAATTLGINGSYTYTAADADGNTDTADLVVIIRPPLATVVVDIVGMAPDVTFNVTAYVQNVTGRVLQGSSTIHDFGEIAAPETGATPEPETVTVRNLTAGTTYTYEFARSADTGYAGDDVISANFTAREPLTDPIMLTGTENQTASEGSTLRYMIPVNNTGGYAIEWTVTSGDGGATIDDTGTFVWRPGEEHGGTTHRFGFDAAARNANTESGTLYVAVNETNQDPVFDDIAIPIAISGEEYTLNVTADDADIPVQNLTYSITFQSASAGNATIDGATGTITWMPDVTGTKTVTISVQDNYAPPGTAVRNVTISVRDSLPAASATVDTAGQNPVFAITAYSQDPVSGRILDDTGSVVYNFTGINSATGNTSSVTTITPEFDPPLEPGNYAYQFARTADVNYTGSDVYNGTFTVQMRDPDTSNRDPAAPDILINAELHFPSAVTPAVTDPDGDNVTITRVTEPTLGILDTSMLPQISYTPSQTGIDRLNYTASDGRRGTDTGTITIFINPEGNARPVLDHIYNVGGRVGVDLNFTTAATDDENDPLTFDLANAPDGAGITAAGDFSWRPTPSQNGTHTVTFIVYDDSGGADWQHVAVTILRADETNLPPVPQDIDAGVVLGGGRGFQPDISDPEGDMTEITRVYDSSLGDVDRSFTSQGIIVYVAGVLGNDEVIYTVSDGRGGFANGTLSITVEEPANVRPLIEFVGDKSINAGDELTFTVDADDLDGLVVDFGLEGDTQGPSMSPQGVFSWTPTANDVGSHEFTILVFDDAGENSTVSITVTVRPEGYRNSPPVAPDVVIMTPQDVLSIVRPTLTDPDEGDPVRISETGNTAKGSILSGFLRAGIIIYLPNQGETGTETITYTVSDSSDDTDTATINVFISARGNTDPILGSIYFRNINAGNPLAFDLEAEDPDGDTISYLLVGAPDNTAISSDGAFSWTPTTADVGNHTFTIVAYDDRGGADSKTAVIRVLPAGTANQAPNAPDSSVTVAPGGSVVITPAISDPDGDRVAITDAVASGTGVVIQSEDSINYIHVATTPTETITYTVTDARGAASTGTITVTIQ